MVESIDGIKSIPTTDQTISSGQDSKLSLYTKVYYLPLAGS